MHAHVREPRFLELRVGRVHELLVVHPPGVLGQVLVRVVADRVALHRIRLEGRDGVIDLVHPAVVAGREDRVREHALAPREAIHVGARLRLHVVGQEPILGHFRRRAADAGDLGVAVEIDFLEVIREHQVVDRLFLVGERGVPSRLADRFALVHEGLDAGARTQEVRVHVHDELIGQLLRPLVSPVRFGGFRARHAVEGPVRIVHREKCARHSGRGLEEAPPAHPEALGHLRADLLDARLELPLLAGLRTGHELIARYRLHGYRRREQRFGGTKLSQLFRG